MIGSTRPAKRSPGPLARGAALASVLFGLLLAPGGAWSGEERLSSAEVEEHALNVARRRAIDRGCAWIASRRNLDGSFGDDKALVAFTALSTLALMSQGSGIDRGPYGQDVRKGVEFLLRLVESPPKTDLVFPRGYFHAPRDPNSKMHGQGYATLALASALASADAGMGRRIRAVLRDAIDCAEASQTQTGGWGYDPNPAAEHEGSVTVTIAQGLRAARDAGLHVSDPVVRAGIGYLKRSQKRLGARHPENGSFKYSLAQERSTYALTAAAISAFFLFGEYAGDASDPHRIDDGVAYMKRQLRVQMRSQEWFYYGHFYAAWAAWQMDGEKPLPESGDAWSEGAQDADIERTKQFWGPWHAKVYPHLLRTQLDDGRWQDELDKFQFGDLLPTTFAVLTLAIPDEMLPVFQR